MLIALMGCRVTPHAPDLASAAVCSTCIIFNCTFNSKSLAAAANSPVCRVVQRLDAAFLTEASDRACPMCTAATGCRAVQWHPSCCPRVHQRAGQATCARCGAVMMVRRFVRAGRILQRVGVCGAGARAWRAPGPVQKDAGHGEGAHLASALLDCMVHRRPHMSLQAVLRWREAPSASACKGFREKRCNL